MDDEWTRIEITVPAGEAAAIMLLLRSSSFAGADELAPPSNMAGFLYQQDGSTVRWYRVPSQRTAPSDE
jgi:hypothetical protein